MMRLFIAAFLPCSLAGCMTDLQADRWIQSHRAEYTWVVPGQQRLVPFILPIYLTLSRDQFRAVRSDGRQYVAATAAQHSESACHDECLYIVEAPTGKLVRVIPTGLQVHDDFCVEGGRIALVGDVPAENAHGERAIKVLRCPDGRLLWQRTSSQVRIGFPAAPAMLAGILRIQCLQTRQTFFFDAETGDRIPRAQVADRISRFFAATGRPPGTERWEEYEGLPAQQPVSASCGDLQIERAGSENVWLVARRKAP